MDENAQKKESFEEETGIDETQDQPLAIRTYSSISKPKQRRPKRGGCGGGSFSGDAMSGLVGDGTSGLGEGGGGDIPAGSVRVVKSTHDIRRGKTITDEDVFYSNSALPNADMLRDKKQAVGRVATQRIPKDKILEKRMVK